MGSIPAVLETVVIVSFVGRRSSPTLTRLAIENLGVGDMVSTVSGELRAIKQVISWTAERKPNRDWTDDVAPIKICRSALAPNVPHRDLYLSPGHALYLDGVLIAAQGLVNDRSIVRCSKGAEDRLTYFQLDLEDHQVIFAEGAPVESMPWGRNDTFCSNLVRKQKVSIGLKAKERNFTLDR